MKKRVLLIASVLFLFLNLSNGLASAEFLQLYGIDGIQNFEQGMCIQECSSGGYIIAGYSTKFISNNLFFHDMLVQKFTSAGELEWSKSFGSGDNSYANFVRETPDKGYLLAGRTERSGNDDDILLVKLNYSGSIEWAKTIGGSSDENANSIQITQDGGCIIGGTTESYGSGDSDLFLIKCDNEGNVEWAKTIGGEKIDTSNEIQLTQDGGYISVGSTTSFGTAGAANVYLSGYNIFIVKCDSSGNVSWSKAVGKSYHDSGHSVVSDFNGSFIVSGKMSELESNGSLFMKLDSSGSLIFANVTHWLGSLNKGTVRQTLDGGFVVATTGNDSWSNGFYPYILKYDSSANLEFSKRINNPFENNRDGGCGYSVVQSKDGGFALTGYLWNESSQDFLLLKTDSNGEVGSCDYLEFVSPEVFSVTPEIYSLEPTVSTVNPTVTSLTIKTEDEDLKQTLLCGDCPSETKTWYLDDDNDSFGDSNFPTQCSLRPKGYVADNSDCNDDNASIFPNAQEIIDELDNDCDGEIDEAPCKINNTSINITGTRVVDSPVTFTVGTENSCSATKYYRFSVHPDYGTNEYNGAQWSSMTSTEYQTENSCTYTFDKAGKYVVVIWSKNAVTDSNTDVEIIGLSVNIGETPDNDTTCKIDINGLTISDTREVGSPITFTMDTENSCSNPVNYRFSYHDGYGTSDYNGQNWKSMTTTEYQTDKTVTFTFDTAGKYIVVVWAKDQISDTNTGVELIGLSVNVNEQGEEPYFPF